MNFPLRSSSASTLLTGFLSAGAFAGGALLLAGGLSTKYEADRTFAVTYSQTAKSETTAMELLIDGEPLEGRGFGGGGRETTFTFGYNDTIVEATEGAPTKIKRVFSEAAGSMSMEMREETMEMEFPSAFDGLTLTLTEKDGEVEAEVTDGDAPEDERLSGHWMALALDSLLPEDEVEAGDEWDIEGEDLAKALGLGLQRILLDRPEPEGGEEGGRGRRRGGMRGGAGGAADMLAGGDWEVTAKMTEETEEVGGLECAVIMIKAEISGSPPQRERGEGRRRDRSAGPMVASQESSMEANFSGEFEGKLLWNAEGAYPVSFTFEGTAELSSEMVRETQRGLMERASTQEISLDINVTVEAGKAESK